MLEANADEDKLARPDVITTIPVDTLPAANAEPAAIPLEHSYNLRSRTLSL